MFKQARWRLVAAFTLILALILVGLSVTVFTLFQGGLYSDVDSSMQGYAANNAANLGNKSAIIPGSSCFVPDIPLSIDASDGIYYAAVDCGGNPVSFDSYYPEGIAPSDIRHALENSTTVRTISRGGHSWRAYTVPIHLSGSNVVVGAIQLFRTVDTQENALRRLETVLIVGGLGALMVAGGAGFYLSDRALEPIRTAFNHQRRFIADASHELRTPLTLIRSSAEMVSLNGDGLDPEDAALIGDIVAEADHMTRLVSDLLILARVDNAQVTLKHDPIDLAEVTRQAHNDVERIANQKSIVSTVNADVPSIVVGDEMRLRQLLLILLDNAIKYTQPGGSVITEVARHNGHVEVSITDSGVGIAPEALPHVFERFYRADNARARETGGAGLGLSIADWIVRAHEGRIRVSSAPGRGSQFTVELPSAQTKA